MPTWLETLKVKEISLVDRGANSGAVSILFKRAGDGLKDLINKLSTAFGKTPEEVEKILVEKGVETMPNLTVEEISKKLEEVTTTLAKVQAEAAISKAIGNISIALSKSKKKKDVEEQDDEVEKLDKNDPRVGVLKGMITELLAKSAKHDEYAKNLAGDEATKFGAMPMKEKDAYMSKNPAEGAEEDEDEDGGGAGNETATEKRLKEVMKKLDDSNAKVEKMEKETEIKKISDGELKGMEKVCKVSEVAEAIFKIRKSNAPEAELIVATLKKQAAENAVNSQILKEMGHAGAGINSGSAEMKLDAQAAELAKKESIPVSKAMGKILDTPEGAELYKQMEEEKRAALPRT